MPCNCSGVRMKTCCCQLVPKGFWGSPEDLVLVHSADVEKHSYLLRFLEKIYEKCAGYNLRYCPFRGVGRRERYFTSAVKDMVILACFLVANFVVFLNITSKMTYHFYYLLRDTAIWLRARSIMKSENKEPFYFDPYLKRHDYSPPPLSKFKLF